MRQVFRKIPVYTGDVSGVCSALYELGGMVVMHDPSGCNSTYSTHDEIRWYDRDSLIFLSGLDEMDAIMGNDEKLIHDIEEAAAVYAPAFIAIVNSPIPYITGMDFDAICRIVEQDTGIPSFYTMTNGMHDYVHGAGLAFLHLAERFAAAPAGTAYQENAGSPGGLSVTPDWKTGGRLSEGTSEKTPGTSSQREGAAIRCNLLGMTPLDFASPSTLTSLHEKIRGAGMEICSCWAMGEPEKAEALLQGVRDSAQADVSLVLASTGLPAAKYLQKKYGIPYVAGIPAAGTEELYFEAVRKAVLTGESMFPFRERAEADSREGVCLIGEPSIMTSLAASIQRRTGAATHVFGATEGGEAFLGPEDAFLRGEEELHKALQEAAGKYESLKVIADPCYAEVLPEGCDLVRLPHLAFSGRIFLKEIPDLIRTQI